jgi:hypothetical protein
MSAADKQKIDNLKEYGAATSITVLDKVGEVDD